MAIFIRIVFNGVREELIVGRQTGTSVMIKSKVAVFPGPAARLVEGGSYRASNREAASSFSCANRPHLTANRHVGLDSANEGFTKCLSIISNQALVARMLYGSATSMIHWISS